MRLVVDLGGTNLRVALVEREPPRLEKVTRVPTAGIDDLGHWLASYLREQAAQPPECCVIGVAGPVDNGGVQMTNAPLLLDQAAITATLGVPVYLINDFAAIAWSLPQLGAADRLPAGGGSGASGGNLAVLGPGTGLGVAGLIASAEEWTVLSGEGGHAGLTVADQPLERAARAALGAGFLAAEDVLCGPGLMRLYDAMGGRSASSPQVVADNARAGDPVAGDAVRLFCLWLGRFAGDLALTLGARGGVYLAGGILPAWEELFDVALFRQGFEDKGSFSTYVRAIPSFLITHREPGLLGLAAAPLSYLQAQGGRSALTSRLKQGHP